jgi:putative ABC transport system ATP-binding protein
VTGPLFTLDAVTVERDGKTLLRAIQAEIPEASCTAVVGASGAGKSTLLRLLNRLVDPTAGTVFFQGRALPDLDVLRLRRRVGLVGQQPVILTSRVRDDLQVGRPDLSDDRARALLDQVGLDSAMLDRSTDGLSGGEAQRVCLARALAVEPQVLLLDEPTSALDAGSAKAVERTVRALVDSGLAVVLVSHNTAQARRLADQVLVLNDGRLADSGRAERIAYFKEEV